MVRFGIILAAVLMLGACSRKAEKKAPEAPLVTFCNQIDYADTAALHNKEAMERIMVKIVRMLPQTDSVAADAALNKFFGETGGDETAAETALELADKYLNNPASPARDETLYIRVLRSMLAVESLPEHVRFRAGEKLKTAMLNRPGSLATDFEFIDREGERQSLHETRAKSLILLFYDPECPHCGDILKQIETSKRINSAIADGTVKVLAIYTEGNREKWEDTCGDLPQNWAVGIDLSGIVENELYDLPAMPTIYLLDESKHVILKDPDVRKIL